MCKLCDRVYHCTEILPESGDCIQRDPEGTIYLMIVIYDMEEDTFTHESFWINFCPICGFDLYENVQHN